MNSISYSKTMIIIASGLLIITGAFLMYSYQSVMWLTRILTIIALAIGILYRLVLILKHDRVINSILLIIISIIAIVAFSVQPWTYILLYPRLYGYWALLNACAIVITYIITIRDNHKDSFWAFINLLFHLCFGVLLVCSPLKYVDYFMFLSGAYCIYMGVGNLLPLIFKGYGSRVKVPTFMSLLVANSIVKVINKEIADGKLTKEDLAIDKVQHYPLEIYVYVKEQGHEKLGHCNFCLNGKTYLFGAYDYKTRRLHGVTGDGVLCVVDRNQYLEHVIKHEHKTAICYGLDINDKQAETIQKRIDELMQRAYEFPSDLELKEKGLPIDGTGEDILSRMHRDTDAKFYHFKKGMFKTYSLVYTNCVYITNYLVATDNVQIIDSRKLLTPGSYYYFLNQQYELGDGLVMSKKVTKDYDYYLSIKDSH